MKGIVNIKVLLKLMVLISMELTAICSNESKKTPLVLSMRCLWW